MIARVSKNFKGTICLPSISQKGMVANETFFLDDIQYWKADVQNALSKRMIIALSEDVPPPQKITYITNVSKGSITVPGIGVIRSGETKGVVEDIAASRPVKEMEAVHILRLSKRVQEVKRKKGRPRKEENVKKSDSEWNPLAWNPLTEDGRKATKSLPKMLKLGSQPDKKQIEDEDDDSEDEEALIFDTDQDDSEETNITWVDHEDTRRRLASHPVLGKKKNANNRNKHKR